MQLTYQRKLFTEPISYLTYWLQMPSPDPLSVTFSALADPTRRAILARLSRGEATVNELSEPFDMSGPAISKHLKVLERAGLISRGRTAQWRPCRIEPRALKSLDDWLDQYRQFWEQRLDRLDQYLRELQGIPRKKLQRLKAPKRKKA